MSAGQIRIKMFEVGHGDSFLITFEQEGEAPRHLLLDCGGKDSPHGPGMKHIVDAVKEEVLDADDNPHIHVVVCSHIHNDHVSGFGYESKWKDVTVDEVWLPWTEDPDLPLARQIREDQKRLALALVARLEKRGITGWPAALALNAIPNTAALKTLHTGFRGPRVKFFGHAEAPRATQSWYGSDALPGVDIFVLGPSMNPSTIDTSKMDPPAGQSYLRYWAAELERDPSDAPGFLESFYEAGVRPSELQLTPRLLKALDGAEGELEELLAATTEKTLNNTSLVLLLRFGNRSLLLPGDAQWGVWEEIMADDSVTDLLRAVDFVKVGHHGSHNATPRDLVEKRLGGSYRAMISAKLGAYGQGVPKEELYKAMRARGADVALSDVTIEPHLTAGFQRVTGKMYVETVLKVKF